MRALLIGGFLLLGQLCLGQSVQILDSLIEAGDAGKSLKLIEDRILALRKTDAYGGMVDYLEVLGRAHMAVSGEAQATQQVERQLSDWDNLLQSPQDHKHLWLAAAAWYEYVGKLEKAYRAEFKAVEWARKEAGIAPKELGKLLVSLGAYAVNRMDLPNAKKHLKEAQRLLEKEPDPESIYRINSFLGNMAYFASRMDSAEYYYQRCLRALATMEPSLRNSHYRPAIVLNNLSGVQSAQGKTAAAIQSMNETIAHLKTYQDRQKDPALRVSGKEFYFQAIDNLAGIYKGLGNFRKAQDLLEFSYERKKQSFGAESKEVWLSEILLGQLYLEQDDPEKAREIIHRGLKGLEKTEGDYSLYEADGWYTLARIEDAADHDSLAGESYRKANTLFQQGLEGDFDVIYLGFLRNYARFLAETGNDQQAIDQANLAYKYVLENQGEKSLMTFQQQLSVGEVFFELRRFEDSQFWSEKALANLNSQFSEGRTLLDSLQIERNKPETILLSAKSRFELQEVRDTVFLKSLLQEMEAGLEALDRRKVFLDSDSDINLMIRENQEYFKFIELLNLELYQKTKSTSYLAGLLTMHESSLYQRIRARLEQVDLMRFGVVPAEFFERERALKEQLKASLSADEDGMRDYLMAARAWEEFLSQTRTEFPEYFEFRYASIQRDFNLIAAQLPAGTTVIRYLFVGDDLYAVVLEDSLPRLFELDFTTAGDILKTFQNDWSDEGISKNNLHRLYQALWEPFASSISHERVLVVPDGILFNLNFEVLTPQEITSFAELATESLLAKHSFSYHYSTLLFDYPDRNEAYSSDFAAFAPGFFDEMKEVYLQRIEDSLQIDRSYLTLIPQPFTDRLVNSLKNLFDGKIFTKEASTLSQFNLEAGQHRILHIATHALSDNTSPDFSRLIFAKAHPGEENSLFAKDIYQLNMRSELAVLMACETGKPTFDPGEGMISLAHAFNYAGSKSLLTGLWKIDEQASAMIAHSFYEYLREGNTKDKALQLAKIDYLARSEGRALSPEFWAGLIVMGDASPVTFDTNQGFSRWIGWDVIAFILAAAACIFFVWKKRLQSQ
jgi:CHAT domain-containing protein